MKQDIVTIRALNKSFGAVKATNNLSLTVEEHHIHALIGPNGAGKTTLVNQISGDILPDSGDIFFKEAKITRLKGYKRARIGICRSFQITHVFEEMTVAENMAVALCCQEKHNFRFFRNGLKSKNIKKKLPEALTTVGLLEQSTLTAKYLSHGEKRQLEVGMALASNPELLILDEPMAGMGPGGTVEMCKLINRLKGKITILLVEHDMDVVFSLADMVTVLVYGDNVVTGKPQEIRNNLQVQQAYLGEKG